MRRSTIMTATFAALRNLSCTEARQGLSDCDRYRILVSSAVTVRKSEWQATCNLVGRCTMVTVAVNSRMQSLVNEYGVFCQFWPQFEQTHGERRLVGFEVELIGSHALDLNHVDPACPTCRHVRSVLLAIADLMPGELSLNRNSLTYNIDSHSNSIVFLPALGNRSAVWVSIYVFLNQANGQSFETDLSYEVKTFLNTWGIRQR